MLEDGPCVPCCFIRNCMELTSLSHLGWDTCQCGTSQDCWDLAESTGE